MTIPAETILALQRIIDDIPDGVAGWWKQSSEETFLAVGKKLLAKGLDLEEVKGVLESLYSATAAEFGQ